MSTFIDDPLSFGDELSFGYYRIASELLRYKYTNTRGCPFK